MARTSGNPILHGLSGAIGKQVVCKVYGTQTIISKYPDMSGIRPSAEQRKKRDLFKKAVVYAQGVIHDPAKKKKYAARISKGKSVYHAALQEFIKKGGKI
jgi:hypothetical protein